MRRTVPLTNSMKFRLSSEVSIIKKNFDGEGDDHLVLAVSSVQLALGEGVFGDVRQVHQARRG